MSGIVNKVLIISGGKIEDSFLHSHLQKEKYDMIIAADHGLEVADRLSIKLDYILGDFDSVSPEILEKYQQLSTPIETFPAEKDKTDTQIALELALMNSATAIDIVGATGSRLDHALANIHLLMLPLQVNVQACLLDVNNKIYLMNRSFTIKKEEQYGDYVSLLPFCEKVTGLTLKGFKYPLNNITYMTGSSLGISNVIIEKEGIIEITDGILLVNETRD